MNEAYQEHSDTIRKQIAGLEEDEAQDIINERAEADTYSPMFTQR
jgi:cell division protein FtsB